MAGGPQASELEAKREEGGDGGDGEKKPDGKRAIRLFPSPVLCCWEAEVGEVMHEVHGLPAPVRPLGGDRGGTGGQARGGAPGIGLCSRRWLHGRGLPIPSAQVWLVGPWLPGRPPLTAR